MKQETFDIIIIGAGSGGLNIASFMNKAGFTVLLIDKNDENIGGDCLNFGCVPSKALIHLARCAHDARHTQNIGLDVVGNVDIRRAMRYVKSKQEKIRKHENAEYLRKQGMRVELGIAAFTGKNSVEINGREFHGKKIVIATGSHPRPLTTPGVEKVKYYTNQTIFDIDHLPERFIFIGGGPISLELCQCFQRFGSHVSVIQRRDTFLPREIHEVTALLHKKLSDEGITFHYNTTPVEFISPNELVVERKDGTKETLPFDAIFAGVGRDINIAGLALEKADIALDETGKHIKVDEYLRTTNKNVVLCGDVTGKYLFTHAAELHAAVILNNFFNIFKKKLSYDMLSWVTYTDPEIATFGLREKELEERGLTYKKLELNFDADDRHIVDDTPHGKLILFVRKEKILGGSMVSPHAGELFQELALAMTAGIKLKTFLNKIYPYPTATRVNKKIIGNYFSRKLTPLTKKILRMVYR
jgi:pyruvate/2-oxoglutarate dehydrogenase complex dihydrolipoamide dehydrogenase (E3) component